MSPNPNDPHAGQPVFHRGPSIAEARLVMILVHGRGATAADILTLADEFRVKDVAYLAPQAAGQTWYPFSFLTAIPKNEPGITSGLGVLRTLVDTAQEQGVPPERVVLLGFSQGACLTLEFAARNATRYHAVVALSGGVIGPPGTPRDYKGALGGTPVFLGCSDVDPHIPVDRVRESAEIFRRLGAAVDERIYPGMGHTVTPDEIEAVNRLLIADR